jgi:hypothetical protein
VVLVVETYSVVRLLGGGNNMNGPIRCAAVWLLVVWMDGAKDVVLLMRCLSP